MTSMVEKSSSDLDEISLHILGSLRLSKTLDQDALRRLSACLDGLDRELEFESNVPKALVGKLWFVFTSMLSEAEHARNNRTEIEVAAWNIQERLRKIFGPHF